MLDKLKALEALEQNSTQEEQDFSSFETSEKPNLLDGYKILNNEDLPQNGVLYPESWSFAYRCPTAKEVANFSTLHEKDQPAIISAIEDLIRKCIVIYDTEKNRQVSSGQINDAHRTFFLLLLREFYLPGNPITYSSICTLCKEPLDIHLTSNKLKYAPLNSKIIGAFNGRSFSLQIPNIDESIDFLIPTIEITSRIFRYLVKVFKDDQNDREVKEDKMVYDKQFLLIAPYLYIRGNETVKEIIVKFKALQNNENLFKAYLDLASKLKIDNLDYIEEVCPKCESVEEALLRFPGGWKNMFISKTDNTGYYD
jgi:hypothetical protein